MRSVELFRNLPRRVLDAVMFADDTIQTHRGADLFQQF
jgi:hypothetical protein